MYGDDNTDVILVQYQKPWVVIGQMGGFANILMVLGTIFSKIEHKLRLRNYLINELYTFQKKKKQKKEKSKLNLQNLPQNNEESYSDKKKMNYYLL